MKSLYKPFYLFLISLAMLPFACGTQSPQGGAAVTKYADPDNVCFIPDSELKKTLTPLQYDVTRQNGTEAAFQNEYWNNHSAGIYVDVISGVPLFSSKEKYDSGTGWPSFWQPIDEKQIELVTHTSYGMTRTEVRSKSSGSHLGHIFDDGPAPTGKRYCMNSAALKFIPASDLKAQGYGEYEKLFK
jgi:methionine-R-sulfoxide reductase